MPAPQALDAVARIDDGGGLRLEVSLELLQVALLRLLRRLIIFWVEIGECVLNLGNVGLRRLRPLVGRAYRPKVPSARHAVAIGLGRLDQTLRGSCHAAKIAAA